MQRVNFAKILMQQGDAGRAFEHLDYAVQRQPDFGPARTELGRWYAAQGNIDAARHQWVIGGQLDEPESLLLLGQSYPHGHVPGERLRPAAAVCSAAGGAAAAGGPALDPLLPHEVRPPLAGRPADPRRLAAR